MLTIFLIIPVGLSLNKQVETQHYNNFKTAIERGFDNWSIRSDTPLSGMLSYLNVNEGRNAITEFSILDVYRSYTVINKDNLTIEYSSDRYFGGGNNSESLFLNEIVVSENFIGVLDNELKGDKNKLVHINGRKYFDYARLVKLVDGDYILYFRYDSEAWKETIADFNRIILSSLLFATVISLILGYLLSKTITSPIIKIMQKARHLAAGEFEQTLEVMSDDEIGQLTNAFNYMAKNLRDTLMEISREKNKIETIFNYMTDGVVAFNLKGEVIHLNAASSELLGKEESNQTFTEFSKKYNLGFELEDILYLKKIASKQVNIDDKGKTLQIYFAVFTDESKKPEGIIAVIHDVTEQQKLDNMRREFVANVSHELRTPLTSIKSYTETLVNGELENREVAERFLRVIDAETDRMTRLVKDLLQLSSLDNKQMKWNMKDTSFTEIIKSSVGKMEIEANNKKQRLECYITNEMLRVKVDKDKIEQVIINLLSNAIKYTPQKGNISVYVGNSYDEAYVTVKDTGIGIPEEDLPRIFERFYRVDKARSREAGGTGLGLSIAREITQAHGGEMIIKSELGRGTEVMVKLPSVKQ